MALKRIQIPSPNFSSRGGTTVRLIVLHTAEGARTIEDLGHYFSSSAVQASSHCGADDTPGTVGEYVQRSNKAWAVAAYNSMSANLELCAFADWSTDEWLKHPHMLDNCAHWIAEEAKAFGIPIQILSAAEAQGSGRGVCQHVDLGAAGGGHHDCGPGFPIVRVIAAARAISQPKPPPPPKPDTGDAHAKVTAHLGRKTGVWEVDGTAGSAHFGGPDKWEEATIGVNLKTGRWRIKRKGA